MTDESENPRNPATGPSANEDPPPTLRTIPIDLDPEALPDQAAQYVAPQPMPRMSEHKTIDMAPVRLAPEINPRNALTRRLTPVPVRRSGQGLLLGGVVAALVLGLLVLGTMRMLGRASSSAAPVPALPAAAVIQEPVVSEAALSRPSAPPAQAPSRPLAPLKATPSASPKPSTKGREVWLE